MSVSERNDLQPPPHHLFSFRNNYFLYVQGEPFVFYFTVSTIGISWPARYLCLIPCYIFLHTPGARGSAPPTPLQGTNLQASLTEKPQQWIQLTLSGSPHQSHDGPNGWCPLVTFHSSDRCSCCCFHLGNHLICFVYRTKFRFLSRTFAAHLSPGSPGSRA